jgi:hypothetical protein
MMISPPSVSPETGSVYEEACAVSLRTVSSAGRGNGLLSREAVPSIGGSLYLPSSCLSIHLPLFLLLFLSFFSFPLQPFLLYVGTEVLTTVVMKSTIFWEITPCSPLRVTDVSEENIAPIFSFPPAFTLAFLLSLFFRH